MTSGFSRQKFNCGSGPFSLCLLSLLTLCGCDSPQPPATVAAPVEVFSCHKMLIGLTEVSCTNDIQGPGVLRIEFRPDPSHSWEVAVSGLAALAEQCEFRGSFDQTRLAALQGRGDTDLVCPLSETVDRPYHTLSFENLTETPNSSLAISVTLTR